MPTRPTPEQALVRLYGQAARTLRAQVTAAHLRGATGTAAYRAAQLERVQQQLRALQQRTPALSLAVAHAPYVVGATAVDASFGEARAGYSFTGSHRRAADVVARNLAVRLDDAVQLVGRRVDDAFRRIALEEVGQAVAAGSERRVVSAAIERRLIREGVTDAVTGFVNARGARYQLDDYTRMVARTTTREAMSAGVQNRLLERGEHLITISAHATSCPICQPYEGNTYALPGTVAEGYDTIDQLPPFHPNCLHVATPAAGNADRFIESLGVYGSGSPPSSSALAPELAPPRVGAAPALRTLVPDTPTTHGLSPSAVARSTAATPDHVEAQRLAHIIAGDPGPDPGHDWFARLAEEDQAAVKAAASNRRKANAALNKTLGPDLAKFIDRKWGREERIRERLLAGELTVDDATNLAIDEFERVERRAAEREINKSLRGDGAANCFVCGRKKSRPSDVCEFCGDDPVPLATDPAEFDRAYGFHQPDVSNANRSGKRGVRGR